MSRGWSLANKCQLVFGAAIILIIGAALVVFVFALGFFVTPAILGGGRSVMAAELIYLRIFQSPNWGLGAAISVILMVLVGGLLALLMRQARPGGAR